MSRTFAITFDGVGVTKQCWTTRLELHDVDHCPIEPDEADIARIVKRNKALASRGFDVTFSDESETRGVISVGIGRHAGSFRIVEVTQ